MYRYIYISMLVVNLLVLSVISLALLTPVHCISTFLFFNGVKLCLFNDSSDEVLEPSLLVFSIVDHVA